MGHIMGSGVRRKGKGTVDYEAAIVEGVWEQGGGGGEGASVFL